MQGRAKSILENTKTHFGLQIGDEVCPVDDLDEGVPTATRKHQPAEHEQESSRDERRIPAEPELGSKDWWAQGYSNFLARRSQNAQILAARPDSHEQD